MYVIRYIAENNTWVNGKKKTAYYLSQTAHDDEDILVFRKDLQWSPNLEKSMTFDSEFKAKMWAIDNLAFNSMIKIMELDEVRAEEVMEC